MDNASKRLSTSGRGYRDALSNSANSSKPGTPNSGDVQGQLSKAVGNKVKLTISGQKATLEGTVYAFSPTSHIVAVNTGSSSSGSTFQFIHASQIVSVVTASSEKDADAMAPIPPIDAQSLKTREAAAIERLLAAEQKKGKGVTKEAQEVFNFFDRMIPSFWDGKSIIVNNNVRIDLPYGVDNCRASKDNKQAETQIRNMLQGYYTKKNQGDTGSGTGSGRQTPSGAGGVRPVVPALPRKGG